jgi:HPt (histidine-containing phosphotransfer) domain-containing protein
MESDVPEIEGVDTATGLRRVAGNKRLYQNLLEQFAAKQSDAAVRIEEALGKGDREVAERLAHTLKGVAGNIGIEAVHVAASKLEKAIRERSASTETALAELKAVLEPQAARIRTTFQAAARVAAVPDAFRADAAGPAVERLMALIEANDGAAADAVQEVIGALAGRVEPHRLVALRESVDGFDFDDAQTKLSQIASECHLTLGH